MLRVTVCVSGGGTNLQAIIDRIADGTLENVKIAGVISNNKNAYALERAAKADIPAFCVSPKDFETREAFHDALAAQLDALHPDLIVLAGFLLIVPNFLIEAYDRRMINIHPALLPKYGGKGMYGHHVHEAVKAAGETETGMTVHYVSNVCDGGEIIAQFRTPLSPDDTPDDIAHKEHLLEMEHFPRVIEQIIDSLQK